MSRQLRILFVDDNPDDRGLAIREVRKVYPEAEILEAVTQEQLETTIESGSFDLVVTDYHLQWSDGIEVLRAVKARSPACPVIMFTATGNEEIAVEAMKLGLDDYIIKNVKHLIRLRGAIQAVLEHVADRERANQLQALLESVLRQLQVGVFSCTSDGQFLSLNEVMLALLEGVLEADAGQGSIASLFANKADAAYFLQETISSTGPHEVEIELPSHENGSRIYRLNARVVASPGREPRVDGIFEDITRRKQAEKDNREAAIAAAKVAMLSPREREVFGHVASGRPNKSIARQMDISIKTVEKHRSSMMQKLGLRSVADLVRLATFLERSSQQ